MERDLSFLAGFDTKVIVNVCGKTVEDYLEVVERLADAAVDMLEINVSCPNVKEGAIAFGQKADCLYDITSAIKRKAAQPIIMKLSPNVTDIAEMARAAEAAGADAISLINTLTGMKIDTVSYTHLDVYKRQVYSFIRGAFTGLAGDFRLISVQCLMIICMVQGLPKIITASAALSMP